MQPLCCSGYYIALCAIFQGEHDCVGVPHSFLSGECKLPARGCAALAPYVQQALAGDSVFLLGTRQAGRNARADSAFSGNLFTATGGDCCHMPQHVFFLSRRLLPMSSFFSFELCGAERDFFFPSQMEGHLRVMDRWILSCFSSLVDRSASWLESGELHLFTAAIQTFLVQQLCDVYVVSMPSDCFPWEVSFHFPACFLYTFARSCLLLWHENHSGLNQCLCAY